MTDRPPSPGNGSLRRDPERGWGGYPGAVRPVDPPRYEPKRFRRHALRTPMRAAESKLPAEIRDDLHGRRLQIADRLDPLGNRARRRARFYVAGAVIGLPLVTMLFTPLGLGSLWIQIPIAAVYGLYVAYMRPLGMVSGLAMVAAGMLTVTLAGYRLGPEMIFPCFAWLVIGRMVGAQEELGRMDGGA